MRLDVYLFEKGLAKSRSRASEMISGGYVTVDGKPVTKPSCDVDDSKDVKVTVKKATLKIDSKAVSFKAKVKTKKYTITLKDSAGRFIKNAKLTLKVKGKSYSATTDSKGKATFKIKNLGKKGTYKADIVYGGNNLYNKIAKTVNIKCK